ncbi:MAG: acyltransferase, partial [Isosphaeraceae bacterium]|nr:acyltransferase [Isosphaeraceae bacterium]
MPRVPELDALRALAALAILLFHLHPPAFVFGWTGVDLFFVLSGYLITTIILDHLGRRRFVWNFYARRGLRIWPIYYLTLLLLVATNPLLPQPYALDALPNYLTYTQNLQYYRFQMPPPFHKAFDHTWTLALEEQFYLIWPALIALVGRRRVVPLCVGVILIAWMAREGGYLAMGRYSERILIARCDGFALGGLLAALRSDQPCAVPAWFRSRRIIPLIGLTALGYLLWGIIAAGGGIAFLGLPTPPDPAGTILAVGLLYFGLVGTIVNSAGHPLLAPLRDRRLCYLGRISYGIYMYHYIVFWAFDGFGFRYETSLWRGALKIGATVAVAALSWHLIEQPILSLKDRFRYDAPPPPAPRRSSATLEPADVIRVG